MKVNQQLGQILRLSDYKTPSLPPEDPSEDLLLRFANGDHSAFNQLVERYATRFQAFYYRSGRCSQHECEDLAQEAFLKILRATDTYKPCGGLDAYVWRLARNVLIDNLRKKRGIVTAISLNQCLSDDERGDSQTYAQQVADVQPSVVSQASCTELAERFQAAVLQLPEEQRTAFTLGVLEGLPYRTVAEVMGDETGPKPIGTIKSRIFYAVRFLREKLREL